ncbi:Cell division protein FtsI/penicillin-binding protein 2 [Lachnospiraceae bacterium NK3A20]|nr:Cell division protein FtsI/penicillin-binding protein 2 [Lachnospiraceae bacterium NK3A20]
MAYYDNDRNYRRTGGSNRSNPSQRARQQRPVRSSQDKRRAALLKEKLRVKKDIIVTAVLMSAIFLAMTVYMVVYSASQEQTLFENDYNGREEALLSKNQRGKIYADDGKTVIADTVDDGNGGQRRDYPFGNLFAHVVGYDVEGGSGVELQNNYDLVHSDLTLAEKASFDKAGKLYPGNEVYTTLNVDLQKAASDALGSHKGAVIVTDIKTGKILCMVSKPDFDPGTVEENWDSFLADSKSGILVNRVTQGLYAPGSTFKIFDAVEFMQEDPEKADNFTFDCPGYVTIDGETITCYHWEVHGHLDFIGAFAHSCNSAFATIGTSLKKDSFNATLERLYFGKKLPYDMPSNVSSYVLENNTPTKEVMQLSIGQGQTLMTPLHLNMITAAIANGGTIYKPYVVSSVRTAQTKTNPEGKVLSQTDEATAALENAIGETICSKMRELMRGVVEFGTGTKLLDRSYDAAGKTGSAEFISGTSESHAWFTGFAPYNNPEVAITVIVEGAGTGGTAAVPIAKDVLDEYFHYDGSDAMSKSTMYTTTTSTMKTPETPDTPENVMELNLDTNGDGTMDAIDVDGDGVADAFDMNGDGIADTMAVNGQPVTSADNGDDTEPAQTTSPDTDGDGIPDDQEDENGNGIPDVQETQQTEADTDGDGIPDSQDPDANGDGVDDAQAATDNASEEQQQQAEQALQQVEQQTAEPDTDGDGIPDSQDPDADGNGVDDAQEAAAPAEPQTPANDTNGNGIDDAEEGQANPAPVDANGDGIDDNTGQPITQ